MDLPVCWHLDESECARVILVWTVIVEVSKRTERNYNLTKPKMELLICREDPKVDGIMYIIGYYVYKFKLFLWYIPYYNCFLIDFSIYELIDHIDGCFILIISNLIVILLLVNPYPITFVILSLLHLKQSYYNCVLYLLITFVICVIVIYPIVNIVILRF